MALNGQVQIKVELDASDAQRDVKSLKDGLGNLGKSGSGIDRTKKSIFGLGRSSRSAAASAAAAGAATKTGMFETVVAAKGAAVAVAGIGKAFAASAAVTGAVSFGKSAVNAAATAQAIDAQFEQVFGNVQGMAQETVDQMGKEFGMVSERLKPALSKTTSMFKGLGMDTQEAMTKAKDAVTIAADAAAFYDMSFENASGALTSFIKGNYEGGEAIGIFANETQMASYAVEQGIISQAKEWASLDEATKQATRLEYAQNMQEMAGAVGQASRESGALENQMGNLKQSWENFLAIIGQPILPIVTAVIGALSTALTTLGGAISGAADKVTEIWNKFNEATGFSTTVTEAFNLIKGGISEALGEIFERVSGVFGSIAEAAGQFWAGNGEAITQAAILIGDFISLVVGFLIDVLTPVLQGLVGIIKTVFSTLGTLFSTLGTIFSTIGSVISAAASVIGGVIKVIVGLLTGDFSMAWEGIKQIVSGVWSAVTSIVSGAAGVISNVLGGIAGFLGGVFSSAWNAITGVVSAVISNISSGVSSGFNNIKSSITNVMNAAKSTITNVWNGIKSTFTNTINSIKSGVTNGFNNIKSTVTNVMNTAKSTITNAWNTVKSVLTKPITLPKIKLPHFSITGKFSLDPPSIPHISVDWYAKGGVFNGPSVVGLGEAGPEAVVPLSSKRMQPFAEAIAMNMRAPEDAKASQVTQNITINVSVANDYDINRLMEKMQTEIKRRSRAIGGLT